MNAVRFHYQSVDLEFCFHWLIMRICGIHEAQGPEIWYSLDCRLLEVMADCLTFHCSKKGISIALLFFWNINGVILLDIWLIGLMNLLGLQIGIIRWCPWKPQVSICTDNAIREAKEKKRNNHVDEPPKKLFFNFHFYKSMCVNT